MIAVDIPYPVKCDDCPLAEALDCGKSYAKCKIVLPLRLYSSKVLTQRQVELFGPENAKDYASREIVKDIAEELVDDGRIDVKVDLDKTNNNYIYSSDVLVIPQQKKA